MTHTFITSHEIFLNKLVDNDWPLIDVAVPSDILKVDTVEMYSRDNAREHRTDRYELVKDNTLSCILRRGQPFFMALRMKERGFDTRRDNLRVSFNFGKEIPVPILWILKLK